MSPPLPARAIALTIGAPVISAPTLYQYHRPPIEFLPGQVGPVVVPGREDADPEVWAANSLKVDVDGVPIAEALFSNHNADMVLECDSSSLVGRTDPQRGIAQKIEVEAPLILEDKKLSFDQSALIAAGNTIITSNKQVQDFDLSIPVGSNAISVGPITIANGVVFTIPTNSRWMVV